MSVLKSFASPSIVWISEYGVKVYLKRFRVSRVILKEFPANIDEEDFMTFPHRNYVLHVRTSFCLQAVSLHMITHTHWPAGCADVQWALLWRNLCLHV